MNPYPFSFENHFTVPSANDTFLRHKQTTAPLRAAASRCFAAPLAARSAYTSPAGEGKQAPLVARRPHRVAQKARDRHRPDPSRDGREMAGDLAHVLGHIAHDLAAHAVDA